MQRLWGADDRPADGQPTVVTVGMFDGVHRGHISVFERVFADAKRLGARSAVVTFDPHPLEVIAPSKAPCLLTTLAQRLDLFEAAGFDIALVLPFNEELASLDPAQFAMATLVEDLHVRKVIVGSDFRFGHDRAGDVNTLQELGESFGFEAEAIDLVTGARGRLSSTDVRRLMASGDIEAAAEILGRSYRLAGTVIEGDRRGRDLGFPTANLKPDARACLPGLGIYAGWWLEAEDRRPGVISVGVRPMFKSAAAPLCEIHIFDFDGDLYGHAGEVEFTAFLRPEENFDAAEALIEQMHSDALRAREVLGA